MRKFRTAVLSGIAALAVAGAGLAAGRDMHVMKVGLSDGAVAKIEYAGDVAPRVTVAPAFGVLPAGFFDNFDRSPFAAFGLIAASVDRDMEAMAHEVSAFQPALLLGDGKLDPAAPGKLPMGTVSYRFISTSNGNTTCSRSVDVTSWGPDQKPRLVSRSSGDCTSANRPQTPIGLDASIPGLATASVTAAAERPRATNTI